MVASTRRARTPPHPDFALDAHPSEQELVASYLTPRVTSGDKSCRFIHEGDVYAAHPADLTKGYAAAVDSNGDEAWYFFTAVRAKGGGRKARTVDSHEGCWHSEAGSKPVVSAHHRGGGLLGYRQNFSFVTKEHGARLRSGWLMLELGLHDDGQDEVTLCKVYFSPRAAKKNEKPAAGSSVRKRKAEAAEAGSQDQCRRARREMDQAEDVNAGEEGELVEEKSADKAEVEDPTDFFWWLRNKDRVRMALGMSEEDFYQPPSAAALERVFGPNWPLAAPPAAADPNKEEEVIMYLTYEEMYDLPSVKEFLSPTKLLEEMRSGSSVKKQD